MTNQKINKCTCGSSRGVVCIGPIGRTRFVYCIDCDREGEMAVYSDEAIEKWNNSAIRDSLITKGG